MSFMGNNGTFSRSRYENLTNFQLVYHVGYLMLCVMGLCVHEFFYSLLVSMRQSIRCCHALLVCSYWMLSIVKILYGMSFNVLYAMQNQLY